MLFGVAGTLTIVLAGLLAIRKKLVRMSLGSVQFWLKGHIWLGLLSVPLILFHAAFRYGGLLENVLWWVFALVVVSGAFGLALQNILPRVMKVELSSEVIQDQIVHVCDSLRREGDQLVAEVCGSLALGSRQTSAAAAPVAVVDAQEKLGRFYLDVVRPYLNASYERTSHLHRTWYADGIFSEHRRAQPETHRDVIDRLKDLCDQRRQYHLQSQVYAWLHGWLLVHVPLSYAFGVFIVLHVVTALYY